MTIITSDESIEEIAIKHKGLVQRLGDLQRDKDKIEANLEAHKRTLKGLLEQAHKEGFDPDNLQEEIKHAKEVLVLKINTFSADLDEAEKIMRPMKQAVEGTSA
jgi:F0F1-type ATP synthase membrane subunit b/b'